MKPLFERTDEILTDCRRLIDSSVEQDKLTPEKALEHLEILDVLEEYFVRLKVETSPF